jgi:hypothetical protein
MIQGYLSDCVQGDTVLSIWRKVVSEQTIAPDSRSAGDCKQFRTLFQLAIRAARVWPEADFLGQRAPSFLFSDLAFRRIPRKSLKSLPFLFSIPTAPTNSQSLEIGDGFDWKPEAPVASSTSTPCRAIHPRKDDLVVPGDDH